MNENRTIDWIYDPPTEEEMRRMERRQRVVDWLQLAGIVLLALFPIVVHALSDMLKEMK